MKLFKRLRDLLSASLNDLLDGLEDPESMINQLIRDMEESIRETRQQTVAAMTRRNVLQQRHEAALAEVGKWQENAAFAVDEKRDDLARQALLRKRDATAEADSIASQLTHADATIAELKQQLHLLEEKVQEARRKRETIVAQKQRAEATGSQIINGFDQFSRYEDSVRQELAGKDAAAGDLDAEFAALKRQRDLEAELAALKQKQAKGGK